MNKEVCSELANNSDADEELNDSNKQDNNWDNFIFWFSFGDHSMFPVFLYYL